jgi:3-oxoacyl-[acyl-carrier protein] reductase
LLEIRSNLNLELKDRVICITGGTRGIGRAIAMELINEGAKVAICGRTKSSLQEAAQTMGPACFSFECDVTSLTGVEDFIEASAKHFGRIDGTVANVGGTFGKSFAQSSAEEWLKTFDVNVIHTARLFKAALNHQTSGASNLVIASISGMKAGPRFQYGAAKAAEISLVQTLAKEFGPKNIRFNALSPGSILFEGGSWAQRAKEFPTKINEFVKREFPFGRMGTLSEVSSVATFLLSPKSSWISGTNIVVDGAQGNPSVVL